MSIYLYVKTHNITGLKYFGKTNRDPYNYHGSGVYWVKHLKKYGFDYSTEIVGVFEDTAECTEFALNFSDANDIVHSSDWANLIVENGLDGAPVGHPGHIFTEDERLSMSIASKNMWADPAFREKMSNIHKLRWQNNPDLRTNQIKRLAGVPRPEHSEKLKGHPGHNKCKGVPKPADFGAKVSKSLSGRKKTPEHCANLSAAMKNLVTFVCRVSDRKEYRACHVARHGLKKLGLI